MSKDKHTKIDAQATECRRQKKHHPFGNPLGIRINRLYLVDQHNQKGNQIYSNQSNNNISHHILTKQ